jgi:hypothetical protein
MVQRLGHHLFRWDRLAIFQPRDNVPQRLSRRRVDTFNARQQYVVRRPLDPLDFFAHPVFNLLSCLVTTPRTARAEMKKAVTGLPRQTARPFLLACRKVCHGPRAESRKTVLSQRLSARRVYHLLTPQAQRTA